MVQAYNFLASWQLFPEKCQYENGITPKSGQYKIDSIRQGHALSISANWVSMDQEAFVSQYELIPDNQPHPFPNQELADTIVGSIVNAASLQVNLIKNQEKILEVLHEIMPNGYLKIKYLGKNKEGNSYCNTEVYHKQMSVLPYASSVGSVAIRPTKEGVIKHKALTAMEEQTQMQLDQIREQIELLARQAQELRKRKELSLLIYEAKLSFKPQIGHTYHLYQKKDGSHILSLVAPTEWGGAGPFQQFVSSVKLLADHTWKEVNS
ncbi:MAG: DUF2452 domain-containing protein [Chitinophagia bacterium]|jgi:hypothetical protein